MLKLQNTTLVQQQEQSAATNVGDSGQSASNRFTEDQVDAAIVGNDDVHAWLVQAQQGAKDGDEAAQKMWKTFAELEDSLPFKDDETLDERFKRVVQLTTDKVKETATEGDAEGATGSDKSGPDRNLSDVSGQAKSTSELDALLAMPEEDQLEYIAKLENTNPAKYERLVEQLG